MAYVLSLDSSTTGTKAVVWDREGRAVAEGRAPHPTALPRPGWNEQAPDDWWDSATAAVKRALLTVEAGDVEALVVTNQRETFACLDEHGRAVRPAIVWMDVRAAPQVESFGSDELHRVTGKPPDTTPALYKLLWLREHEPDAMARTHWVVDVHAYMVHRLTGSMRTTTGCADPLGLIDLQAGAWSDALLELCGLRRAQMPDLAVPGDVIGELSDAAGSALGLAPGLPVVGGTGDGQAVGVGANVLDSSRAYLNLGTAVVAGTASPDYRWERAFRTLTGPLPGTFTLETLIQGGTYTLDWFLRRVAGLDAERLDLGLQDVDLLEVAAARLAPGAEGLLLLPYWASTQTPYWDPYARGMLFGLAGHHGKEHMFRAMLEGIAFEQRLALEGMGKALGAPVAALMTTGGGSRSALWRQILADVCGTTIVACREPETTSLGAAVYAAVAVGWHASVADACDAMTGDGARHAPEPAASARYDRLYAVYRELYPRTAELHRALHDALED